MVQASHQDAIWSMPKGAVVSMAHWTVALGQNQGMLEGILISQMVWKRWEIHQNELESMTLESGVWADLTWHGSTMALTIYRGLRMNYWFLGHCSFNNNKNKYVHLYEAWLPDPFFTLSHKRCVDLCHLSDPTMCYSHCFVILHLIPDSVIII